MNVGMFYPQKGFLDGLRQLCDQHGALLIFDEVKTGAKLGWGGASEYFGVMPDMICLAKSIGGGFPPAGFGAHKRGMEVVLAPKSFHCGTFHTKPSSIGPRLSTVSAGLTPAQFTHHRE